MAFFSRQTVDSIVADITQKIENLHAVAELHKIEQEAHAAAIAEKQKLVAFAEAEYTRAKAIAEKLTALIHV